MVFKVSISNPVVFEISPMKQYLDLISFLKCTLNDIY